jgi:hypothetical protein
MPNPSNEPQNQNEDGELSREELQSADSPSREEMVAGAIWEALQVERRKNRTDESSAPTNSCPPMPASFLKTFENF